MKRYEYSDDFSFEKQRAQGRKREYNAGGFKCNHCKRFVVINDSMGTANRNHCNWCLWSKHVDVAKGDRRSHCHGGMEPIGLTFKHEGYGKVGELMVIHRCSLCQKLSINRIARDDPEYMVLEIFEKSLNMNGDCKIRIQKHGIYLLGRRDAQEVSAQLFGK